MASNALAVVTGASTGIGFHLAECCVRDGFDLVVCADEPEIEAAARALSEHGASVEPAKQDLATDDGRAALLSQIADRPVEVFIANSGRGLGHAFLDQDVDEIRQVIELNVTGTVMLTHAIAGGMRARNQGRILFTGSIAGQIPGSFQAVYNATKAFVNSFAVALGDELRDTPITVTCLEPGPTETEFFNRAHMEDTPVGQDGAKADAASVAEDGYKAMMAGKTRTVSGIKNKAQSAMAGVMPQSALADMHRKMAEPDPDAGEDH